MGRMKMTFGPDDDTVFEATCQELLRGFTAFLKPLQLDADPHDLDLLLTWKRNYGDGRLGHWTRNDLTDFLLGWCPRKLSATASEVHSLPATVGMAMSFLAQEKLHSGEPVNVLLNHAIAQQDDFLEQMDNPANFGMAKSLLGQFDLGPEEAGPTDFYRALDEFGTRPQAERESIIANLAPDGTSPLAEMLGLDPSQLPAGLEDPETLGPVMMPSQEDVRISAAASPLLAGFVTIAEYIGVGGKTLTARGNLKIADAVALADLLHTGEEAEYQIGTRTFKRKSAHDFPRVDHWQWWAWELGVIRPKGNQIVANGAWLRRCKNDPIEELKKAFFEVYDNFGLLGSMGSRRPMPIAEALDELVDVMLGRMLQAESTEFDELVAVTEPLVDELGIQRLPDQLARTWDRMITLLEQIGILTQEGAIQPAPRGLRGARSGGTLRLTPIGIVIAVELARHAGIAVEEIPPAKELHPADLVSLTETQALSPEEWWTLVDRWLEAGDEESKLQDLITQLGISNLGGLAVILQEATPSWRSRLVPLLRAQLDSTERESYGIRTVAINWLVQIDALDVDELAPEIWRDTALISLAILAERDPSSVVEILTSDKSREEQLNLIAEAGRLLIFGVVSLLEAIATEHPDKVVAKAARKELFRVRSNLVTVPSVPDQSR